MNKKDTILTVEQLDFCFSEANKLAKEILEKDIYGVFPKEDGNSNFSLEVTCILAAGIIAIMSKRINYDKNKLSDLFISRVKSFMNKKTDLRVIQ